MPDDVAAALFASTQAHRISTDAYVSELVSQVLANERLGESAKIENRPDWLSALQLAHNLLTDRERCRCPRARSVQHVNSIGLALDPEILDHITA